MALNPVSKENIKIREPRLLPNETLIGGYIRTYVIKSSSVDMKINPAVINEIVEKFTYDEGDPIHKIIFTNGKEMLVNDAGLVEATGE